MTRGFWGALAGAAVVLGIVVAIVWYSNQKNHLAFTGKIIRVRVETIEQKAAIVLVDFRITNQSDVPFKAGDATLKVEGASGQITGGLMVARADVDTLFEYMQQLKPKYNEVFGLGQKIAPGKSGDFMVEARFEMPKSAVEKRKTMVLHLQDLDGEEIDLREAGAEEKEK